MGYSVEEFHEWIGQLQTTENFDFGGNEDVADAKLLEYVVFEAARFLYGLRSAGVDGDAATRASYRIAASAAMHYLEDVELVAAEPEDSLVQRYEPSNR